MEGIAPRVGLLRAAGAAGKLPQRDPHDRAIADEHDQAVDRGYACNRVRHFFPLRADGHRSLQDMTSGFIITFRQPGQNHQLVNRNLSVGHLDLGNGHFRYVGWILSLGPTVPPFGCRVFRGWIAVIEINAVQCELYLSFLWMSSLRIAKLPDLLRGAISQQLEPFAHQLIRDAHYLVELVVGLFADSDVISQALPHSALAIQSTKNG